MPENYELEWLKADKKMQEERYLKTKASIKNVKSFNELFDEQFFKATQKSKQDNKISLFDYFNMEQNASCFPSTALYKDVIENEQMLKEVFLSELKHFNLKAYESAVNAPISFKKNFVDTYNLSIDARVSLVSSKMPTDGAFFGRASLISLRYKTDFYSVTLKTNILRCFNSKIKNLVANFYGEVEPVTTQVKPSNAKLTLNNLGAKIKREVFKEVKALEKRSKLKDSQIYLSNIKMYSLTVQKHTYPVYEIRCQNKGIDYKAIVCASSKKLVALYK